jgi:hypothetical protein
MLRCLGCVLLLSIFSSPAFAHDPFILDARRAVPESIRLDLVELSTTPGMSKRYRLQASGAPRGIVFGVFTKDFAHSFHEAAAGFQADESGNLFSGGGHGRQRLDDMVFETGPYPRGAAWEIALVSADRALRAFAKVIPYPISAHNGSCVVGVELVSHRGDRFVATGAGFAPGEDVSTESRYSGRVIQKQRRISPEGILLPETLSHGAKSSERRASFAVRARSCNVVVSYEWGEPALFRR